MLDASVPQRIFTFSVVHIEICLFSTEDVYIRPCRINKSLYPLTQHEILNQKNHSLYVGLASDNRRIFGGSLVFVSVLSDVLAKRIYTSSVIFLHPPILLP